MTLTDSESRRVRDIVYQTSATQGRPPSLVELARRVGSTTADVHHILTSPTLTRSS